MRRGGLSCNIFVIINISGDRAIFLLFCVHQDTEYEKREMEMIIA